ncbi:MAG: Ldh family oxidoreductase [Actinobacteria bacterium]|nr:Ldh family oxidoreductase [Actinomycetota bacterium]
MPVFPVEPLTAAAAQILVAAGTPVDIARSVAGWLAGADLAGHASHGLMRVPWYVQDIQTGQIRPAERPAITRETETTVVVDGHAGFGFLAAAAVTERVAAKAQRAGVAAGAVVRGNHIGRLGAWAELAAERGVVFWLTYGGPQYFNVVPFGGARGRLATNPMTFAAPAGGTDPMILDFATSAVAAGKIWVARDKGHGVPAEWIVDKHGRPTTKTADYFKGGALRTAGGHKGYALSLMVELLSANLTATATDAQSPLGVFALGIDPNAFGAGPAYAAATRATFQRMRSTPPAEGFNEVQIPGDYERRSRATIQATGIAMPEPTWQAILDCATSLGLEARAIERLARGE